MVNDARILSFESADANDLCICIFRSNGHLRQTLHKARTLCDKLRPHGPSVLHAAHGAPLQPPDAGQPPGRLARWFSIRRGSSNQYEVDSAMDRGPGKMPLLPEVSTKFFKRSIATSSANK